MTIARFGMAVACMAALSAAVAFAQAPAPEPPAGTSPQKLAASFPEIHTLNDLFYSSLHGTEKASSKPLPPPFVLTSQQQKDVDKVLNEWAIQSDQVKSFQGPFQRFRYDPTFLPPKLDPKGELVEEALMHSFGRIKFAGLGDQSLEEDRTSEVTNPGTPAQTSVEHNYGEHFTCDKKTITSFDHERGKVQRGDLPPEFVGKLLVSEAFLPFAFGPNADALQARYFVRIVTMPNNADEIRLEIRPRFENDPLRFTELEVILRAYDLCPSAIQITHAEVKVPIQTGEGNAGPEGRTKVIARTQRDVYVFEKLVTRPK
jgi:hypothetical protein